MRAQPQPRRDPDAAFLERGEVSVFEFVKALSNVDTDKGGNCFRTSQNVAGKRIRIVGGFGGQSALPCAAIQFLVH
jgi:hypothetical protein